MVEEYYIIQSDADLDCLDEIRFVQPNKMTDLERLRFQQRERLNRIKKLLKK